MRLLDNLLNRFFNKQLKLQAGKDDLTNSTAKIDPYLAQQFDYDYLNRFENFDSYNDYCKSFFSQGSNTPSQYDYRQLIQYMEQNGSMDNFLGYHDYLLKNTSLFYPSKVHGIEHTERVTFNAEVLTMLDNVPPYLKYLIMNAALLHDIGRSNDKVDPYHGNASVELINRYHLLDTFKPRDKNIICFAIACHSMEPEQVQQVLTHVASKDRADYLLVLNYLQDADKLDRVRIANEGMKLDPYRLATDTAKRLVKFSHQNFGNFDRIVNYERKKDKIRAEIDLKYKCYNELRKIGIIITYQDFELIVNEYNQGTLELLEKEGRVRDILAYDTFQKYGKRENVLSSHRTENGEIDFSLDGIFEDAKKSTTIAPLKSTIENDYMLLYNLKKNHPDAYSLYMMCDTDISISILVGILSTLTMKDIIAMRDAGYPYRISDIVALSENYSIEELRTILDNNDFDRLASAEHIDSFDINRLKGQLSSLGINFSDNYIFDNFKYLELIAFKFPAVLKSDEFKKYSLPEIYAACSRVESASERVLYIGENDNGYTYGEKIPQDDESVLKYLQFFKTINARKFMDDNEQFDIISEVGSQTNCLQYPSYISYVTKSERPYEASTLKEKVYYKRFCIEKILDDKRLSLDEAKQKLMLALFDFDVPKKYISEFQQAFLTELHYHQKYFGNSKFEQENAVLFSTLRKIFDSSSIQEFSEYIKDVSTYYDLYNFDAFQRTLKSRLMSISKEDITHQLQNTANMIDNLQYENVVATDGTVVKAKVLRGHPFTIATTTQLPICSYYSKYPENGNFKSEEEIKNELINSGIDPYNVCTSISTDYMISRAAAVGNNCELVYGYVPRTPDQISLSANHDLSTRKVLNENNEAVRVSQKPTLYLQVDDAINLQVESHGETIMNDYPRYIFCYDEINSLAIEKKKQFDKLYSEKNIQPPVDIVLVKARDIYIPRIKATIRQEHAAIMNKCRNGTFSIQDLDELITNKEGNVVTRTIQAANSVTIKRDILFQDNFQSEILASLIDVLEEVAKNVPPDRMYEFRNVVQLLIDRGDSNTELGKRYYNFNYKDKIPIQRLSNLINGENDKTITLYGSTQGEEDDYIQ